MSHTIRMGIAITVIGMLTGMGLGTALAVAVCTMYVINKLRKA